MSGPSSTSLCGRSAYQSSLPHLHLRPFNSLKSSQPKSDSLRRFLRPLTENKDLVSLEGQLWKQWRNVFNPGFSASNLIHLVPQIAKEVSTFCQILRERAQAGDMFLLEEATVNLTMDTIGRVALCVLERFESRRSR